MLNITVDFMRDILICLGWKDSKMCLSCCLFVFYTVIWPFDVDAVRASDNKVHQVYSKHSSRFILVQSLCFSSSKVLRNKNFLYLLNCRWCILINQSLDSSEVYIVFVVIVCCCSRSVSFPTVKQPWPVSPPCGQTD